MSEEHDIVFHAMGSDVRLLIGRALLRDAPPPAQAGLHERAYVEDFAARLSRFRADSELSSLNRDLRTEVPASPLLRTAVRAGLWAAHRSGGLVDPTLLGALERAGYKSFTGRKHARVAAAGVESSARTPTGSPAARAAVATDIRR